MASCFRPIPAAQLEDGTIVFMSSAKYARGRLLELPCGKCIGCIKRRAQSWALRCMHEAAVHDANSFVTLTYDDCHLPKFGHLQYVDFQLFMKRLRKSISSRIRFFVAGEYGDRTKRPHFHALIFGHDFLDGAKSYKKGYWESPLLSRCWSAGGSLVGPLTSASAAYVAQYAMKKLEGVDVDPETGFVREPKIAMSKGIGRAWFDRYHSDLSGDFAVLDGYEVPVPRYYRDKLRALDPVGYEAIEYERFLRARQQPLEERTAERRAISEHVALAQRAHYHSDREV